MSYNAQHSVLRRLAGAVVLLLVVATATLVGLACRSTACIREQLCVAFLVPTKN